MRVLIVEDHDDARAMLRVMLELNGCEVHEAGNGKRGVELLLHLWPDVALIDIGLPGLDGYGVAKKAREAPRGQEVVLIALSGYGQPEDRQRALEAGFDAHLVKPGDPDELTATLAAIRRRLDRAS